MRRTYRLADHKQSRTWVRNFIQAFEFCGFTGVRDTGGARRNELTFVDHNGRLEISTFELRVISDSNLHTVYSESSRMTKTWAVNGRFHAFWMRTETQDIFALYRIESVKPGGQHTSEDGSTTHRVSFPLEDYEIMLVHTPHEGFKLAKVEYGKVVLDS